MISERAQAAVDPQALSWVSAYCAGGRKAPNGTLVGNSQWPAIGSPLSPMEAKGVSFLGSDVNAVGETPKAIGLGEPMLRFSAKSQDRCKGVQLSSVSLTSPQATSWGKGSPPRTGYSPLGMNAAPGGDPSRLARVESVKRLGVSLVSRATRLRLRAPSGAAQGSRSHGWRVGRGRAARLGAHRSQGWRRLQRGEGLPGKLAALGVDFGLRARFGSSGRARPLG